MPTALVIGGTSFLGRHLTALLQRQNTRVVSTSRRPGLQGAVRCDIRDRQRVFEVVRAVQPDWVFNCAAETSWPISALECYRTHVLGTLHLLQAIRSNVRTARTVLFGSAAEYGSVPASSLPIVENQLTEPLSIFGTSKLAQTELARQAATEWNLRLIVVRPFNIVGPGQGEQYLASRLIQRLRNEHNP
ncbi:MAG: NAD-dependent epimerase/dehydratase family protein, partial [Gemmataceae bacterium]